MLAKSRIRSTLKKAMAHAGVATDKAGWMRLRGKPWQRKEKAMTDEQINIAIAESLGWHSKSGANGGVKWVDKDGIGRNGGGLYGYGYNDELKLNHLPDYTADLNACHELEKTLNDELDLDYSENLESVTWTKWGTNNSIDMCKFRSATARQRCEAYLKTIGKWIK